MRLRNIPGATEALDESDYVVSQPTDYKGLWASDVFHNNNPIHLEIGTGKGQFITTLSAINPDINYIGIDRYSSVLIKALSKIEASPTSNLRLIRADARHLTDYFGEGEIDKIYLNFSDPWPKDRHAKRRLTSPQFLGLYSRITTPGALLEFKTDNLSLFEYSLSTIDSSSLWEMCDYTYDLHNNSTLNTQNVLTEYEEKFSKQGNPIYKLIARVR